MLTEAFLNTSASPAPIIRDRVELSSDNFMLILNLILLPRNEILIIQEKETVASTNNYIIIFGA